MESKKRIYSEAEKERRRAAERKRMEDQGYRDRKNAKNRLRMESYEARERKRAMDRERRKLPDSAERNAQNSRRFMLTGKYKDWLERCKVERRDRWLSNNTGKCCSILIIRCLECGCLETKDARFVKQGKASSAYCSVHAGAYRWRYGVNLVRFSFTCIDCGSVHFGKRNRVRCAHCAKQRIKARKRTAEAKEAKRRLGVGLRQRARRYGCYVDSVIPTVVFERDRWRCVGCGIKVIRSRSYKPNQATVDHRIPLSKGGSHTYENCQTMCMMCNSKKVASIPSSVQLTVFDRVAIR